MKTLIIVALGCLLSQALSFPTVEDASTSQHVLEVKRSHPFNDPPEIVAQFRRDIETWFVRFQNFYDRSNAAMRNYRLAHVDLITRLYNDLLTVKGDDIQGVVELTQETSIIIEEVRESLGGNPNACLQVVIDAVEAANVRAGLAIQTCSVRANQTFESNLRNTFYPAFAEIQAVISTLPNQVTDALSRGNVLQDEREIIEFLRSRYESNELQFVTAVSQLLRWESSRFENESLFLIDEMVICNANALINFILDMAPLQSRARSCSTA